MKNIMLCGVGGQGLVMTSGIIAEVARLSGYDVKTNDVIGLSQRGGRVWASIRFGEKVYSPNIEEGSLDYLLALEPLEGYRYSKMLKEDGVILMNDKIIYPADVVFDKSTYPFDEIEKMKERYETYALDASHKGVELGNKMVANTIILGMLAGKLTFDTTKWLQVIRERVPEKAIKLNEEAFRFGYNFVNQ
ncbi:pyruvate ferredoxin oxidoreductase [Acidaminobacter sp. JC074]|uniref:indolepyruvate oxidoreductase subunit beta n=1 Tax=Acidaminobacter sp. JC074 TaxID=2530199 RepID=UPI001F0F8A85|nr:indolepyruvate oxidoreductase subunit beta [Acidaminobacter sp. JC074]MCH4886620.1 pyruvate ferredoxin oxidoreductase [Acidaminobacter sp. JC074]